MRRIVGLLPGGQVTAGVTAIGGSNLKIVVVVDMATAAGNICVAGGQRETGGAVIELGA
jgi:hypothetical protein